MSNFLLKTIDSKKIFQEKNRNTINLLLNHLAVVYMFFIPFAPNGYAIKFILTTMFVLIIIRGYYLEYFKISLSYKLTQVFLLLMAVHYIWLLGTSDSQWASTTLKYSNYLLYPMFFFLFLDQSFYKRLISSFLISVFLSELLSYLMQFNLIPWGYYIDNIQFPWKELGHYKKIIFYSSINNEPAPFLEHSWYSVLLSLTSSILFYYSFYAKSVQLRFVNTIFFITLSVNLFFIGGRTGYILYILLLIVNFVTIYKDERLRKTLLYIIFLPFIIIIMMYFSDGLFKQRVLHSIESIKYMHSSDHPQTSLTERLELAKSGLVIIPDNFFFGVGTGDHLQTMRNNEKNEHSAIQRKRDVHNQYIDMFMQFGLVGFLFYINILYQIAKIKVYDKEKNTLKNLTLVAMIFVGFLGSFWYFLPILFTSLLIVSTSNKDIITTKLNQVTLKSASFYFLFILLSYLIEKLQ